MKKSNFKIWLTSLIIAFSAFTLAGGISLSVNAESVDPVDSLALEQGAAVRYVVGDTSKTGICFTLKMKATDYATMTGEGSAYSDVTFGVLIAPEYYHDIYAINYENVFGTNAKYYLNDAVEAGKEKIINLTGILSEKETGEEGYVYFRASLIDILGTEDTDFANNIALDFRGVGYVKYTLAEETVYKFVDDDGVLSETNEYDDDNVRSMATVAAAAIADNEERIAALDVEGKTAEDQETIDFLTEQKAMLQTAYIDNVNYTLAKRTYSQTIDPLTTTSVTVPSAVWALKDTYFANKYSLSWTFAGSEVTSGQTIAMPTLTGSYDLIATATNKADGNDVQEVYKQTYTVDAPKLDGAPLNAFGAFTYDEDTGLFDSRTANMRQFFVDSVTDGDYVTEATITTSYKEGSGMNMPGIIIGTAAYDNYIVLKGQGGSGRMYVNIRTSDENGVYTSSECYISGNNSGADTVGGITKYTVARVNGTYYVYSYNGKFCCSIDSTGIYLSGNRTVSYEGSNSAETINARLAAFYSKGTKNIVGIYSNPYNPNAQIGYTYNVNTTLGTEAAAAKAIGVTNVNGLDMAVAGTAAYAGNGVWKNADTTTETRQYYLNTVVRGTTDFVLEANVEVETKTGFGGWTGVSLGFAKTTRSDKTLADSQARIDFKINNSDITSGGGKLTIYCRRSDGYNMNVTVKGFKAALGASGEKTKITIVKLNNKMYVYDNTDALVCTMDAEGVYGATEQNVVAYEVQNQGWYASNIGYSVFTGAPDVVAGMYYAKYTADHYGVYKTALNMVRGTDAANDKVNPA